MIAGLAGLFALASPAAAQAQEPWACDNVAYVTQFDGLGDPAGGTSFNRADVQPDGTVDLVPLGVFGAGQTGHLNAIGFRAQDGLMYGYFNGAAGTPAAIIRISQNPDGTAMFENIGLPADLPAGSTVTGMVMADGRYALQFGDETAILDVSGATAVLDQTLTAAVPGEVPGGDWAVNPVDGEIYGATGDGTETQPDDPIDLWRWEIVGDTLVRAERVSDTTAGGAQWFIADGTYFSYLNAPGGIYRTDLETGEVTQVATGPDLSNVDGASCANTLALTKDASPRTVSNARGELTYTYTITSRGLFENPVDFVDQLPAGMRYVAGGVTVSPAFGPTNDYGGTDTLSISGTMAPGETVTITARVRVGQASACDTEVENQAQATMSAEGLPPVTIDSDDPTTADDPGDPTIVEVTCAPPLKPKLVIKKSASTDDARPGEVISYRIKVANKGKGAAKRVKVCDNPPSGLTVLRAPGAKTTAKGTCWKLKRLAPGKKRTFRVIAQVKMSVGAGALRNVATATAKNAKKRKAKAKAKVQVQPAVSVCASWRVSAAC